MPYIESMPVIVSPQRLLNNNKSVISEFDLLYISETKELDNLEDQGLTGFDRITATRNNNKIPTKHIILTKRFP